MISQKRDIKIGIGFATGRKSFKKVLRTYINNWKESGLVENIRVQIYIFVSYDLAYNNTRVIDYTNIHPELLEQVDGIYYFGNKDIKCDIDSLLEQNRLSLEDNYSVFTRGYAGKRNAILMNAIKTGMDYLLFLDDDEYPLAVTKSRKTAIWGGQHVLATHLKGISNADITNGHHCGYISPIPSIPYNDQLTETDFRHFIEAISNDVLNWEKIKSVLDNGGVTYADTKILTTDDVEEVVETENMKFITGANLCINLTDPSRTFPFYNPPGARGEDTFLSTLLRDRKVLRVPCYTFHDGFSTYNYLTEGVLPIRLKPISPIDDQVLNRFYRACIGWIRYKPLLLFITHPHEYDQRIQKMQGLLGATLPKLSAYFDKPDFMNVLSELQKYHKNVRKHYDERLTVQRIWSRIADQLSSG